MKRNPKLGSAAFAVCVISGEDCEAEKTHLSSATYFFASIFADILAYPQGLTQA
jgi:hypothetical protein